MSIEGQGHFLTLAQGRVHSQNSKRISSEATVLNEILYERFQKQGNEKSMTWCWSHDQDGHHAHIR